MQLQKKLRNPPKPQKGCSARTCQTFIALMLTLSFLIPSAYASDYTDVPNDAWYAEAVTYVTEHGLMGGVGNGKFAPDQELTRAQIVELFYRLAGSPETAYTNQFQDVGSDSWFARSVAWASSSGIASGTSSNTFSPSSKITNEQLATMIDNYVHYVGVELLTAENPVSGLKDTWYVSEYAIDGVQLVWRAGIMNGDSQHNFGPQKTVSRADAAVIFMRLSKALAGEQLTVSVRNTTPDYSALSNAEKEAQALEVAKQIASTIPTGISDLERVSTAAQIISYYCGFCNYTMEGKDYKTPFGVFVKGEYSCAGATRALGLVLTCMGYEWKHINENQYSHQWIELNMDGKPGWADGQMGLANYGEHNSDSIFDSFIWGSIGQG